MKHFTQCLVIKYGAILFFAQRLHYCTSWVKPLTHGATMLEMLHAAVAIGVSPLEFLGGNVVEVESKSPSALLRANVSES